MVKNLVPNPNHRPGLIGKGGLAAAVKMKGIEMKGTR
jgi:hypothetical protein